MAQWSLQCFILKVGKNLKVEKLKNDKMKKRANEGKGSKMLNYRGAGLENVWLLNGYKVKETKYGTATSVEDIEGLHNAIGQSILNSKPKLSGEEFRFFRKEMGMSQQVVADKMGCEAQTVANWEKEDRAPKSADLLIRALYTEIVIHENVEINKLIECVNTMDAIVNEGKRVFQETETGWTVNAA